LQYIQAKDSKAMDNQRIFELTYFFSLRVLGFGGDEINRIFDCLYPALANEIQQPINTHVGIFEK